MLQSIVHIDTSSSNLIANIASFLSIKIVNLVHVIPAKK
jgi:hypothetical protein